MLSKKTLPTPPPTPRFRRAGNAQPASPAGGRPITILGIDPGFATMGYGIIEYSKNKITAVDYGCILTSPKLSFSARLEKIHRDLKKIISQHSPARIAVEDLFFAKNAKTAMKVGEARGVIMLTVIQAKIPVVEFTPLQVKQAITGYGQATKEQIQKMVKVILNLKEIPKPDDAADALAIAICAGQTNLKY